MSISNKQKSAIAAILVGGALALWGVLFTGHGDENHDDRGSHEQAEPRAAAEPRHSEDDQAGNGVVRLTDAQAGAAGIRVDVAGPGKIVESRQFPGEIRFNEDRTAHVVSRLPGLVESVSADLGEQVKRGQLLAVISSTSLSDMRSELLAAERRLALANATFDREKKLWEEKISAEQDYLQAGAVRDEARIAVQNASQKLRAIGAGRQADSLNQFQLRAPFDGMIVEKHVVLGEAVGETTNVFTISDLGTVWAEFIVAPGDLATVRVGERVTISSSAFPETVEGTVSYVGSLLGEQTRTAKARVTLANPGMSWRPGLFITVKVMAAARHAAVAVPVAAINTLGDSKVIFAQVNGGFVAQPVKTGRGDDALVEVLEGLAPGTRYASANTFTLKAELGKASVEHAH